MRIRASVLSAVLVALASGHAFAAAPQTVTMRTEDGVTLFGSFFAPGKPGPGVILLHMQTRSREDWNALGSRLADSGFAALAIDLRGHGASDPPPAGAQDPARMQLDVKAARGWLAARADVRPGSIGIVGASIGANLAILYAAGDPSVRSLALLSAGLDYRGLKTEAAMGRIGKRAALLVASDGDAYAASSARKLSQVEGGTRELQMLGGSGHGTAMLTRQPELIAALVDWFRRTLL